MGSRGRLATAFRRLFSSGPRAAAEAKRDAADVGGACAFAEAPIRRSHALAETVAISVGKPSQQQRLLILPVKGVHITSAGSLHVHYGCVPGMVSCPQGTRPLLCSMHGAPTASAAAQATCPALPCPAALPGQAQPQPPRALAVRLPVRGRGHHAGLHRLQLRGQPARAAVAADAPQAGLAGLARQLAAHRQRQGCARPAFPSSGSGSSSSVGPPAPAAPPFSAAPPPFCPLPHPPGGAPPPHHLTAAPAPPPRPLQQPTCCPAPTTCP
jgi:hypothetical protein